MLEDIERQLHAQYLATLNIYRFVKTDAFRHAYKLAAKGDLEALKDVINNQNRLTTWAEQILKKNRQFEYMNVRDLRDMVMELGYPGYTKMVRIEMISILTRSQNVNGSKVNS